MRLLHRRTPAPVDQPGTDYRDPEPATPGDEWTRDFDASLDVTDMIALVERREVLAARLRAEGQSARLAAAKAKLEADYATEKRRLEAEAAERNKPKAVVVKPAMPEPHQIGRARYVARPSWGMSPLLYQVFVRPLVVATLLFAATMFILGPTAGLQFAHVVGRAMGTVAGIVVSGPFGGGQGMRDLREFQKGADRARQEALREQQQSVVPAQPPGR